MMEIGTPDRRRERNRKYGDFVGQRLVYLRRNQSWLSEQTGIKRQTIGQIIRGGAVLPPAEQVGAISLALGVTPNDVFQAAGWWEPPVGEDSVSVADRDALHLLRSMPPAVRDTAMVQLRALAAMRSDGEVRAMHSRALRLAEEQHIPGSEYSRRAASPEYEGDEGE